jgi:hypothetical protein
MKKTEYGLFSEEGLVEGMFYSPEEATKARDEKYDSEDGLKIKEICPKHLRHPLYWCEECDREEDERTGE